MPTKSPFTIPVKQIIHIQLRFPREAEEMMRDSLKLQQFFQYIWAARYLDEKDFKIEDDRNCSGLTYLFRSQQQLDISVTSVSFKRWLILQAEMNLKFSGIECLMLHNPNIFSYNGNEVANVTKYYQKYAGISYRVLEKRRTQSRVLELITMGAPLMIT